MSRDETAPINFPCRADRPKPGLVVRCLPVLAFALFAGGYWISWSKTIHSHAARSFDELGKAQFGIWAQVLGVLLGFALAIGVYSVVSLCGLLSLLNGRRVVRVIVWTGAVAAVIVPVIIGIRHDGAADTPHARDLATVTQPITVIGALCLAPGLISFLAMRSLAGSEEHWLEGPLCQIGLLSRLRSELRRVVSTLGAFLTLLVAATGMRRRALIANDPTYGFPSESVLLYGLVFAVVLGLFFAVASFAIEDRAQRLLHGYAPLPSPTDDAFSEKLRRRNEVAGVLGTGGGTWRTFETSVVIAAPLLSALIGTAIGK